MFQIDESIIGRVKDVQLYNVSGRLMSTNKIDSSGYLDFTMFGQGIYFIKLEMNDGSQKQSKLVIN